MYRFFASGGHPACMVFREMIFARRVLFKNIFEVTRAQKYHKTHQKSTIECKMPNPEKKSVGWNPDRHI